jgi:uncharacterized sulfatase
MNRRDLLKLTGISITAMFSGCDLLKQSNSPHLSAEKRPNIIFIMSDDQGSSQFGFMSKAFNESELSNYSLEKAYYGTSPYSAEKALEAAKNCSPTIDKLCENGMFLTNFHVGPACAPTRAALLTSKYPQGWGGYINNDIEEIGMAGESSPMQNFQKAGYATACIGKWHSAPLEKQHPLDYGFDYFFGFGRAWTTYHNSEHLVKNKDAAQAKGYLTEQLTDEALSFIDRSCDQDKPFMLYLPYNAPHSPTDTTPQSYYGKFDTGNIKMDKVYGAIYAMDKGIARIIDKLKHRRIDNNTLIMFTVDNGCPFWFPLPANGKLKGYKRQLFEGGTRTPLIAYWPGRIPAGRRDAALSIMDILPTALDAAGITVPEGLDGISMFGLLTGKKHNFDNRTLFWAGGHGQGTIEARLYMANLAREKGHFTDWYTAPGWYVIRGKWKLISPGTGRTKLYDIKDDPGERIDLADKNPEVVREMTAIFAEWIKDKPAPAVWDKAKWQKMIEIVEQETLIK